LLLDGLAIRFTSGYAAAIPKLSAALGAFDEDGGEMRWLWLAWRGAPGSWDGGGGHPLAPRAGGVARDAGALTRLPVALTYRAGVHVHGGEFDVASALVEEAQGIVDATGDPPLLYTSLVLPAWRGYEAAARGPIEAGIRDAKERGEGRVIAL